MRLYESCFAEAERLLAAYPFRSLETTAEPWPDAGKNQIIFRGDTLCEPGGGTLPAISGIALTDRVDLVPRDEILLCGPDLPSLRGEVPYARLALFRVKEESMGEGSRFYQAIRKIEYTRYHVCPEGFMVRISAMSHRESVRVGRSAIEKGLDFAAVGQTFIRRYHEHPAVEAVKLLFITHPDFPYAEVAELAEKGENITKALDHLLQKVKMDCNVCSLKTVCAEVEALCNTYFPKT